MSDFSAEDKKIEGLKYPAGVITVLTQHYTLLQRNLLYTGVARGEKRSVNITRVAVNAFKFQLVCRRLFELLQSHLQRFCRNLNQASVRLIEFKRQKDSSGHRKSRREERANYACVEGGYQTKAEKYCH